MSTGHCLDIFDAKGHKFILQVQLASFLRNDRRANNGQIWDMGIWIATKFTPKGQAGLADPTQPVVKLD